MIKGLVSIVIPIYNAEQYLEHCLESIRTQRYKNFEVLMVDDGSKDSSAAISDEYARIDCRFRSLHIQNNGVSNARNLGIQKASGEFVTFVDADDYVSEYYLESFMKYSHYDLVSCGHKTFGERNLSFGWNKDRVVFVKDLNESFLDKQISPGDARYLFCWGHLFRTAIIKENNLCFNTAIKVGEDTNFNLDYISLCNSIVQLKECNIMYRTFKQDFFKKYPLNCEEFYAHALEIMRAGKQIENKCQINHFSFIQHNVNVYLKCFLSFLRHNTNYSAFKDELKKFFCLRDNIDLYSILDGEIVKKITLADKGGYVGYILFKMSI